MIKKHYANQARLRRHRRVRKKVAGTSTRPRLSVFRSGAQMYAQIIDDLRGHTLVAASSRDADFAALAKALSGKPAPEDAPDAVKGILTNTRVVQARAVGQLIAQRAKAAGVTQVVFDRGGYIYHGRVAALAYGAREGGLDF
ncbi:MAG: LSU ribosomal protein L18p (L5e) [Ktedonobacterales bacterium]|jgi:large subunit ribosomal protein L18|nr:MAG: LSU ribosomal protein L18p (L5e) [Ktedonobacterales bacterium]